MSEGKRVVRPHADEAVWRDRVERWAGSGLTPPPDRSARGAAGFQYSRLHRPRRGGHERGAGDRAGIPGMDPRAGEGDHPGAGHGACGLVRGAGGGAASAEVARSIARVSQSTRATARWRAQRPFPQRAWSRKGAHLDLLRAFLIRGSLVAPGVGRLSHARFIEHTAGAVLCALNVRSAGARESRVGRTIGVDAVEQLLRQLLRRGGAPGEATVGARLGTAALVLTVLNLETAVGA